MTRLSSAFLRNSFRHCAHTVQVGLVDALLDLAKAKSSWHRVARSTYSSAETGLRLIVPEHPLGKIFPAAESAPATLVDYVLMPGIMPIHQLLILCQLVRLRKPKAIFEIGTFLGGTTLQLAANSHAEIYTLDLPPPGHNDYLQPQISDPQLDVYPDQPGTYFQSSPYKNRIHQLFGDSKKYNFAPYYGNMDFVFVDGCHHYEFVLSDSKNALKMMSRGGMVIWDDYAAYAPGVVQALNEMSKAVPLTKVAGTTLVIHRR